MGDAGLGGGRQTGMGEMGTSAIVSIIKIKKKKKKERSADRCCNGGGP